MGAALVAALVALLAFGLLAGLVVSGKTRPIDQAVFLALQAARNPWLIRVASSLTILGQGGIIVAVALLIALFGHWRCGRVALTLIVVTGGADLLNTILKVIFLRPRPLPYLPLIPAQVYAFPSGHAMVSTAFYLFLAYLAWPSYRGWPRRVWVAGLILLIPVIDLTRLYLGVHYLTDVIGGALAGFLWTDLVLIGERLLRRTAGTDIDEAGR